MSKIFRIKHVFVVRWRIFPLFKTLISYIPGIVNNGALIKSREVHQNIFPIQTHFKAIVHNKLYSVRRIFTGKFPACLCFLMSVLCFGHIYIMVTCSQPHPVVPIQCCSSVFQPVLIDTLMKKISRQTLQLQIFSTRHCPQQGIQLPQPQCFVKRRIGADFAIEGILSKSST